MDEQHMGKNYIEEIIFSIYLSFFLKEDSTAFKRYVALIKLYVKVMLFVEDL